MSNLNVFISIRVYCYEKSLCLVLLISVFTFKASNSFEDDDKIVKFGDEKKVVKERSKTPLSLILENKSPNGITYQDYELIDGLKPCDTTNGLSLLKLVQQRSTGQINK